MSNLQNIKLLEELMEEHEERFGTRPTLDGLSDADKVTTLQHAICNGYPVEFDFDGDWQGARIDLLSREIRYLNEDILALRKIQNIHLAIITIALLLFLITIL